MNCCNKDNLRYLWINIIQINIDYFAITTSTIIQGTKDCTVCRHRTCFCHPTLLVTKNGSVKRLFAIFRVVEYKSCVFKNNTFITAKECRSIKICI